MIKFNLKLCLVWAAPTLKIITCIFFLLLDKIHNFKCDSLHSYVPILTHVANMES